MRELQGVQQNLSSHGGNDEYNDMWLLHATASCLLAACATPPGVGLDQNCLLQDQWNPVSTVSSQLWHRRLLRPVTLRLCPCTLRLWRRLKGHWICLCGFSDDGVELLSDPDEGRPLW